MMSNILRNYYVGIALISEKQLLKENQCSPVIVLCHMTFWTLLYANNSLGYCHMTSPFTEM